VRWAADARLGLTWVSDGRLGICISFSDSLVSFYFMLSSKFSRGADWFLSLGSSGRTTTGLVSRGLFGMSPDPRKFSFLFGLDSRTGDRFLIIASLLSLMAFCFLAGDRP